MKEVGRILKGTDGSGKVPTIPNGSYAKFLMEVFSQQAERIALVDNASGASYTYGDLHRLVLNMSNGLRASGVRQGDSVVVISTNHIDVPVVYFSTMLLGATCVPVNPMLKADSIARLVSIIQAQWAVAHVQVLEEVEKACASPQGSSLKSIWVLGDASRATESRPSLEDLKEFSGSDDTEPEFDPAKTVALMPWSSGTTGFPKGVMLSHRNILTSCAALLHNKNQGSKMDKDTFSSTLLVIPVCHIYGYLMMNHTLLCGGKVVFMAKFSTQEYLQAIQRHKIVLCPLTPPLLKYLTNHPDLKKYDLSSLKIFQSGSISLPGSAMEDMKRKSGKKVLQGYGLTETSGVICVAQESNVNSVGKLLPLYEGKVINTKTGQLLGEGQVGELCVRGPYIMMGYANNPEATAEIIDSDGWLHTGDLCYYDKEDFIYLTDRMKDIIKVKGYQVSPAELESIIKKVPGVSDVAVAGVQNKRLGEAPKAWVVPVKGATLDAQAIIKYVADRVAPYKQLVGGVEMVETLPRNFMNKVLKRELRLRSTTQPSKL